MKLLICTQTVDANDPVLGFFVRWVEEFAKHCDGVEVVCLGAGEYTLSSNVRVHSAGKEKGVSRLVRWWRVLRYIVVLRKNYDAVFVHMNPEYLIVGGWLWKLLGKKVGFWYMHKAVNMRLRVATLFADDIFTASKESFRLPTSKLHITGHGIDTVFFVPDSSVRRGHHWLSLGRLNTSKRHDLAVRIAAKEGKELRIVGDGPERSALEALAHEIGAAVTFVGGLNQAGVRDEFRRAAMFVHTSETGSFDKVVLEALACGCPVRTSDLALKFVEHEGPEYVRANHSLQNLIPRILKELHG